MAMDVTNRTNGKPIVGPSETTANAKPDNDVRLMQRKGSGGYGRIPGNLAGHEKRNVSAVTTP